MHCISERREHTAVANTHVEDLCVGGVVVLLNDMAKLTLSDANLTVLTAFVRKRLVANVCRIMIYGHMHCIVTCPPLSRTCTLTSHNSPESSRRLARGTHRLSAGRRHAHMCSSHPTLRTSKKQKTSRTFYFSSHVTHLYYYSCGEHSLGIVYIVLSQREAVHAHTSSLTPTRGYT